jgi:hypothetical protein
MRMSKSLRYSLSAARHETHQCECPTCDGFHGDRIMIPEIESADQADGFADSVRDPVAVVYTITVLSGHPCSRRFRHRDWGYYFNREDAAKVIEENQTDLSELDYYHYAVLSAKGEGPLAVPETLQWYEFVWDNSRDELLEVKKIDRPKMYKHLAV